MPARNAPERQRESRDFGERREAESDQQQVQHEELGASLPCDDVEPRAHRLLSQEQDQRQREGCLDRREPQLLRQFAGAFCKRGDDDQERDDREILEQQMPMMSRPCGVASSIFSASIFDTMAVELIASAPPSAKPDLPAEADESERRPWRRAS
jgi:hypothetical protein